jgi:hypothetical protein
MKLGRTIGYRNCNAVYRVTDITFLQTYSDEVTGVCEVCVVITLATFSSKTNSSFLLSSVYSIFKTEVFSLIIYQMSNFI